MGEMSKAVSAYWLKNYVNNGLCSLCGNYGVVDTQGVQSPAAIVSGRLNFCICPNGQAWRKGDADIEKLDRSSKHRFR
jgi:hypothetical protein